MKVRFLSAVGREVRGMHEAAYLLAGFALLSQLLALLRDRILAAQFGAGHTLDLYYAAFRIPDFIFATVASLLSLYALLPILSKLEQENQGYLIAFLRDTLWVFFAGMSLVCGIVFLFVPELIHVLMPGIAADPVSAAQLTLLIRILLLQPILLGASNTLASLTQLRHRFILYSVSPLLYNIGIIFGALFLYPRFGVAGLGWGVVAGAFMHMLVQLPFFFSEKRTATLGKAKMLKSFWDVLALSVPRTFALAANQISLLAITALASYLAAGSISVFTFGYNLQAVPLTIIGVSYSVAAFPTLARLFAAGKRQEFSNYIETALRHIIFWSMPATIFVVVLRAQLVRVILGAGQFDWSATRLVAASLALLIISLVAQSISLLIARAYYAAGNTSKPLYYGIIDVVVSVGGSIFLIELFHSSLFMRSFIESLFRVADIPGTTVLMLALGLSLGSIAECAFSFFFFCKDFNVSGKRLRSLFFQTFSASVIGAGVTYIILAETGAVGTINTALGLIAQGSIAGLAGLGVTALVLYLLKNPEFIEARKAFGRYFKDTGPVAVEPTDVVQL